MNKMIKIFEDLHMLLKYGNSFSQNYIVYPKYTKKIPVLSSVSFIGSLLCRLSKYLANFSFVEDSYQNKDSFEVVSELQNNTILIEKWNI